jgi:hypothetical protein
MTPMTEVGASGSQTPAIVVSDNPQSPVTLIPATDGSSTRPTKGGIAYPFSLKVGDTIGQHANASMVTLESLNITTPPAVDEPGHEKELRIDESVTANVQDEQVDQTRPGVERFYTTGSGAGLFSNGAKEEKVAEEPAKVERPGVERFETALEDLSTLAAANEKKV